MKFIKPTIIFILYLFSAVSLTSAQTLTLNTTNLNSTSGLSQNSIQCILKDRLGFMWFGTQDGLNKYDGFKFTIYKHSTTNPNSLPANLVNALQEDADGNLWIGTRLGGLSRYDRAKDSFLTFKHDSLDSRSISDDNINVIYKDKNSNLWIGTSNGLNVYDRKTGKFKRFLSDPAKPYSLSNSSILSVLEDRDGALWIGTSKGLNRLDGGTGKFIHYSEENAGANGDNNRINAITEDAQKNIWIGTGRGLNLVNKTEGKYRYYAIEPDKNLMGNINSIYCFGKTNGNRFWIGSNTTLQLFDTEKRKIIPINPKTDGENTMPTDGISSILDDNAGILWIGTTSEGIIKYDRNLTLFPAYKASLTSTPSSKNIIRSIAEDQKGNLYLGTDVGFEYFDRLKDTYKSFTHDSKNLNTLSSNYVLTVIVSKKNGLVWIGTYSTGLDCFDPKTRTFKHFAKGTGPNNINGNGIYALMEDRKGNIWIGAEQGGVQVYNPDTKKFTRYAHQDKNLSSVCDDTIDGFLEDKDGNIWMGGYSNGISIFNPSKKTFSRINSHNSNLSNNIISTFYEDANANVWIGTMEGGLNCYEKKTGQIKSLTEKNGFINNTINYIAGDSKGCIWLSTIQGITRYDPIHKKYKNYGYRNGLKSLEFNFGTGAQLKSGEIAFGNINGFNIVDPDKLLYDKNIPLIALTGFELFNKPVDIGTKDSPLKQSISAAKEITLNHSQSIFSIEFAALDYSTPEDNKYAYKLEGFDNEWRYVGNQRKATYTNLDPGTYTFYVKAANKDDVWNEKATTIKITIVPPFWLTWWFRALCFLAVIGIYYSFYIYRITFIEKQKVELEKQVKIRTLEIEEQAESLQGLNHELQSQKEALQLQSKELLTQSKKLHLLNKQLTNQKTQEQNARLMAEKAMDDAHKASLAKSTFLATMSHEIRTPMNGVLGMAALLAETQQDKEQRDYTDAIINSGESLLLVINDILDFSKIESGNLELDHHSFNLKKCIEDVLTLFTFKAAEASINIVYHIDGNIPAYLIGDSLRLRQVLTNLVGNALKFTHKGSVSILVTAAQTVDNNLQLCFEIKDTGIGIPETQIEKLFQAFNQIDSSITRKYGGSGLGLVICERLVKLMGGTITVNSKPGIGSTFSFSINCREDSKAASTKNSCGGKNVLVIEGRNDSNNLLHIQLESWQMNVTTVSSGKAALEVLSQKEFDLIITDVHLPDKDALALNAERKNMPNNIPFVLLSSGEDLNAIARQHLFSSVLTSPLDQRQLYDVITPVNGKETANDDRKKSLLSDQFALNYPLMILVAEDNMINQKLIMRVLNKLGYEPDLANDGQEVLNMISKKAYDLILMDIQMPNMDGLEATRLIRSIYGARPLIVAMTANALSEDKDNCFAAGMDDYLSKPLSIELLTHKLKDLFVIL